MTQEVNMKHPPNIISRARRIAAAAAVALVALPAAAVALPGDRDASFQCAGDLPGVCTTDLVTGTHDKAMGVAADALDRAWVAGSSLSGAHSFMSVARYTKSGLDLSFHGNGWRTIAGDAGTATVGSDVVATPDDGAVIAGYQADENGKKTPLLVKLNNAGQLEHKVLQTLKNPNWSVGLTSIARQKDGKIVVAGPLLNTHTKNRLAFVARYTEAGALDTSFSPGPEPGIRVVPVGLDGDQARELQINDADVDDTTGRILLVGTATYSEVNGGKPAAIAIALKSNGAFATAQDGGWKGNEHGVRPIQFSTREHSANAVAIQRPGGKFIVAGHRVEERPTGDRFKAMTARFLADGTLDGSYGGGNGVTTWKGIPERNLSASDVASDNSGRIVVTVRDRAVRSPTEDHTFTVIRYDSEGGADFSFGAPDDVGQPLAEVRTNIYPAEKGGIGLSERAEAVAVRVDGKIVVAGYAKPPNPRQEGFAVVVYHSD
jgi:uncharacterized delta-60 repeat protein